MKISILSLLLGSVVWVALAAAAGFALLRRASRRIIDNRPIMPGDYLSRITVATWQVVLFFGIFVLVPVAVIVWLRTR
ncbi:MAG: hypothetical protein ABR543_15430 [Gemmatimonadaceae bacterium]